MIWDIIPAAELLRYPLEVHLPLKVLGDKILRYNNLVTLNVVSAFISAVTLFRKSKDFFK